MINVNGLKRNAKNIVKKYSDAQIKVREATSNDPWGPSSTIMSEIADLTYNVVAFSEIMQMIWKRLNDHGKNWRHVYKALVLLEYLIKTGTEKVAQQCIENIFAIQTLKDFQYMEENKDHGMNIREKSKKMVALLKDSEMLKAERARALKAKARLAESMSSIGKSSLQGAMMSGSSSGAMGDTATNNGSSTSNGNSHHLNYHNDSGSSSSSAQHHQDGLTGLMNSDLDSARPQTATEEENQLKLALALSKEEAEQQEKTRKNDELRLKLALDVSKKTASSSLLDDFNELPSTSGALKANSSTGTLPISTAPATTNTNNSGKLSNTSGPSKNTIDDLLGLTIQPQLETIATPSNATTTNNDTNKSPFSTLASSASNSITTSNAFPEPHNDPWSVDPWSTDEGGGGGSVGGVAAVPTHLPTLDPLSTLTIQNLTTSQQQQQQQPIAAFNDLITSAMQSMPNNQLVTTTTTTLLGNNQPQQQVPPGILNNNLTATKLNTNNIFNNLSNTNDLASTAIKRPMSSKNPFQD